MIRRLWPLLLLAGCTVAPPQPPQPEAPQPSPPVVRDAATRAKAHTELGMAYYQGGRFEVAIEEGRKALAVDSGYAPAHNLLGLVHLYLQQTATAALHFQEAARLAPDDSEINNSYGWFLCTQKREKEGIQRLLKAAADPLYPLRTRPYTNAGLCARRLNDDRQAEQYFRDAVLLDGGNIQALYHLADIAYQRQDYAQAKQFVDTVVKRDDSSVEALWLALRIERQLGDRVAEARYANRIRRNHSGSKEYQALMQGQYE